ncbi:hypothetical protein L1889_17525 [Paenalcaligenes niemegkensis]|uniref:hypothetical protein n=1 Tax=Paenalcaligenes niemegkensis TaxID=2895469 RepID=UPI001EE895DA|nr:hypothetical protein [Paenalcaligenes niemegkensis]MCQ9618256.1 hypothetical protein [Paenalcaligenes niemegkensis]
MIGNKINVLAFSGYYSPGYKGGGPIKTLANLFSQTSNNIDYRLITKDRDLGDNSVYSNVQPGAWNEVKATSVFYSQPGFKGLCQISKIMFSREHDLVYLNSFFSIRFSLFPLLISKLLAQRVVLGPRGELSAGALSLKVRKKDFHKII